ncbi:ArnT family glycosyltransferase [Candidatus Altiarchaeota archaeon]
MLSSKYDKALLGYLLILTALLLSTLTPGIRTTDEFAYLLMIKSYAVDGTFEIWNGLDEINSKEQIILGTTFALIDGPRLMGIPAPLYTPLAAPFYIALGVLGVNALSVLAYTMTTLLVYCTAKFLFTEDDKIPFFAAVCYSVSTYTLGYSQMVWPQTISVLFVSSSVYFLLKFYYVKKTPIYLVIAGFLSAYAVGIRYPNAIYSIVLFAFIWLKYQRKELGEFATGYSIPIFFLVVYNIVYFHHPFTTGYGNVLILAANNLGLFAGFLILGIVLYALRKSFYFKQHRGLQIFSTLCLLSVLVIIGYSTGLLQSFLLQFIQKIVFTNINPENFLDKKALLQSTPYLVLALFTPLSLRRGNQRDLLALLSALALAGIIFYASKSLGGLEESLGIRYLLETVPFLVLLSVYTVAKVAPRPSNKTFALSLFLLIISLLFFINKPFILYPLEVGLSAFTPVFLSVAVSGAFLLAYWKKVFTNYFVMFLALSLSFSTAIAYADAVVMKRYRDETASISQMLDDAIENDSVILINSFGDEGLFYNSKITKKIRLITVSRDNGIDTQRIVEYYSRRDKKIYTLIRDGETDFTEFLAEVKEKSGVKAITTLELQQIMQP